MPNPEAIKKYIQAREAFDKGDKKAAADLLANSLGAPASNPVLENSLDQLLENDSRANDVVLKILSTEVAKRERRH
jgi:hypothetical protein